MKHFNFYDYGWDKNETFYDYGRDKNEQKSHTPKDHTLEGHGWDKHSMTKGGKQYKENKTCTCKVQVRSRVK